MPRTYGRNIVELSYNHFCSGKVMGIAYSDCVFVALGTQHAMRRRHIVTCSPAASTIFFPHYLINGTIFGGKNPIEHKVNFDFL